MKCKNILGYTFVPLDVIIINDEKDLIDYHYSLSSGIKDYASSHKGIDYVRSMKDVFKKFHSIDDKVRQFCIMEIVDSEKYRCPGVYLWYDGNDLIYIGETENIYDRFHNGYGRISPRNVFYGGQSTNCKMNYVANICGDKLKIYYMKCKDNERKKIESELLNYIQEENENGKSIKLYNQSNNKKEYQLDILDLKKGENNYENS